MATPSAANTMMKKVILVMGAGAGIGGTVAKRFAKGGYHAFLCRRSDQDGLDRLIDQIQESGGQASGTLVDLTKPDFNLKDLVDSIESKIGPIDVCVYNLGAQIGNRDLFQTTEKQFELGWRLGTFGLFRLTQAVVPYMKEREQGSILVTSSTAAFRGNAGQHSHAAAMGGRRMLCQTLNAELAPNRIHVSHILIDGAVDAPDTLGKMIGQDNLATLRSQERLIRPEAIAETYWHLAHQDPSAQTFELDLRNHKDRAWWNAKL